MSQEKKEYRIGHSITIIYKFNEKFRSFVVEGRRWADNIHLTVEEMLEFMNWVANSTDSKHPKVTLKDQPKYLNGKENGKETYYEYLINFAVKVDYHFDREQKEFIFSDRKSGNYF